MGTAFTAALASFATAEEPSLIESKLSHYSNDSIEIDQISGEENMTMITRGTYADPDPIQTANTENFYVEGIWSVDGSVMTDVYFYCNLQGVKVFEQTFHCSAGDANCPSPTGVLGEDWYGVFVFDFPGFAPPFQYDVHVIGQTADGTSLWELESKFYI